MMRITALALFVFASLAGCGGGGGGGSHLKIEQERVAIGKEYLAVLESAVDEASAKAAVPKIEAIAARLDDLAAREKKLGDPTEEDFKQMMETINKGGGHPSVEITKAHSRIGRDEKLREILAPAMNKINK